MKESWAAWGPLLREKKGSSLVYRPRVKGEGGGGGGGGTRGSLVCKSKHNLLGFTRTRQRLQPPAQPFVKCMLLSFSLTHNDIMMAVSRQLAKGGTDLYVRLQASELVVGVSFFLLAHKFFLARQ